MSRAMFRYEVPILGGSVTHALTSDPVAVAHTAAGFAVEFWAEDNDSMARASRAFRVFGTGQPLPDGARWVGTCPRTGSGLVWHLFEVTQ